MIDIWNLVSRLLALLGGISVIIITLSSAIQTFVLPRSVRTLLTRWVFLVVRNLFRPWTRRAKSYYERDRVMALYAPISLLVLPVVWLICVTLGYTAIYWALGIRPLYQAFTLSGSALLTLGFAVPPNLPITIPDRSWITAAGAVLGTVSLFCSVLDVPAGIRANLCIRAGYLALRHIADFFQIPYNAQPKQGDPISISRQEFDEVCEQLATQGIPLKVDREQAWLDFGGWRVNYDTGLIALCQLISAPYAPWSSDRSIRRPPNSHLHD